MPNEVKPSDEKQERFNFTKLVVLLFMNVSVRGPLFRVEDLTNQGWNRGYVWKALRSLESAGVVQKLDRKSYAITEYGLRSFRAAFGGGVNDAPFTYSILGIEGWGETRLDHFKTKVTELWQKRPDRVKLDPARIGFSEYPDYATMIGLIHEKILEVSSLASMIVKATDYQDRARKGVESS